MAVAFDKHIGSQTLSMSASASITVPAGGVAVGEVIIVRQAWTTFDSGMGTVTDSRGNSYAGGPAGLTQYAPGTTSQCAGGTAWCTVTTALQAGDTITIASFPGGAKKTGAWAADAWSGLADPATGSSGVRSQGLAQTSFSAGALVPVSVGDLVYGWCGCSTTQTNDSDTTNGSWVAGTKVGTSPFNNMQYKIVTGTTSFNFDQTFASGDGGALAWSFPAAVSVVMPVQPIVPSLAAQQAASL